MKCNHCEESNCIKKGKRNNFQRYYCKRCKKHFQDSYSNNAYMPKINDSIKCLLKEGCGISSISRILKISKNTVLSRMLKISSKIKAPKFPAFGCKFEVDELWTFIGTKNNMTWLTYVIERETRQVIDFFIGVKSKKNIKPLMDMILGLRPKAIYTDRLNVYPPLIPKEIHKVFNYCTNIIERKNLTLRTHVKRLSRRTICYSKKQVYLEAHLRIYFWG